MLNTLQFNMSVPTPYVFMQRFFKAAQSDKKVSTAMSIVKACYYCNEYCVLKLQLYETD